MSKSTYVILLAWHTLKNEMSNTTKFKDSHILLSFVMLFNLCAPFLSHRTHILVDVACKHSRVVVAGLLLFAGSPELCWGAKLQRNYSPEFAKVTALLKGI